jgi:hypothetical protein
VCGQVGVDVTVAWRRGPWAGLDIFKRLPWGDGIVFWGGLHLQCMWQANGGQWTVPYLATAARAVARWWRRLAVPHMPSDVLDDPCSVWLAWGCMWWGCAAGLWWVAAAHGGQAMTRMLLWIRIGWMPS